VKKCKKIVHWSWDTTLWHWDPTTKIIDSVATDGGMINSDLSTFSYPSSEPSSFYLDDGGFDYDAVNADLATFVITNTAVMLTPAGVSDGGASLTRNLKPSVGISWKPSSCTSQYNVIVDGDITRPSISFPSCQYAHGIVKQKGYRTITKFTITPGAVVPCYTSRAPISFDSLASLTISDPLYGTQYLFTGSPVFPVTLDTDCESTVNFTGMLSDYKGPITITGQVKTIYWLVQPAQDVTISKTKISCGALVVTIPETVNVVKVIGSDQVSPNQKPLTPTEPINITIDDVPLDRAVEVIGVSPLLSVSVSDMKAMKGYLSFVGNSNDDNYIHVDMDTPADRDVIATAYPTHFAYDDSDVNDTHVLRHANANIRSYSMKASPGRKSTMRLIAPEGYEKVNIDMMGASDAVLRNEIGGCDRGSLVNVKMYDEGTHTLVLGSNGKLGAIQCEMNVFTDGLRNDQNTMREVLVNASSEERELVWEFNDGNFIVSDSANTNDFFRVNTGGLNHVTVHFSQVSSSQITFNKREADGIEYVFLLPEESENVGFSSATIPETHSPILLSGPVMNVVLGDIDGSVAPLSRIGAVVVAPSGSNIILNSQNAEDGTHIAIQENCVFQQDSAAVPKPSDWFIAAVKDLGIDYKEGCNVLVPKVSNSADEGFSTTFDITAGSGADSIDAMNSAVHVVADMGAGDDIVNWLSPDSSSRLFLQLGEGSDTLSVQSAGVVNVDLGDDLAVDHVTVVCEDVSPSILHTSVFPIGVRSDARMEISHWDSADTIEISRFDVEAPAEREVAWLSPDVNGTNIIYQMNHNTEYRVKKCAGGTSFSFSANIAGVKPAEDSVVDVSLDNYDTQCNVVIDSAANSNNSVTLGVDSNALFIPSEISVTDGAVMYGQLSMTLGNVDQFGIAIPPAFVESGNLTITGSPTKEMFINLPSWETVIGSDVKDTVVMSVDGKSTVTDLNADSGMMLIALGTKDKYAEVDLGTTSMKEMVVVNGCMKGTKTRTLSNWILERAKETGFSIEAEYNCSALFRGTRFLTLTGDTFQTVRASGLGWNTVRSLWLPDSVKNVIVEDVKTETKDTLWTAAVVTDNEFIFSKNDDDAFKVTMYGSKTTLSVGSSVFVPSATISVDCSDTNYHHVWNIALDEGDDMSASSRTIYSDMNFTSNGATCSGRINNRVYTSMDTAPSVRVGKGLGGSVLVETNSPKNATIANRYVNYTTLSDGMNQLRLLSSDYRTVEAKIIWDSAYTTSVNVKLGDRSENVIQVNENTTKSHPLYLSASVYSGLSFSGVGSQSISFEGVEAVHFNIETHSFDLLGGKNVTSNVFCFSPCDMCSNETWNEIRVHSKPCSLDADITAACSSSARIHVVQDSVPALLSVSCSQPDWDPTVDGNKQCAVSYNANGANEDNFVNLIPSASQVIAGIVSVGAAFLTLIGASVLLSRILFAVGKTSVPEVNRWWLSNMMRDFYNDQFSWASVALTACAGSVSDFDISNWNGAVDGLVLESKSLVFGWLDLCKTVYPPVVIVIWALAASVLILRALTAIGGCRDSLSWSRALRIIDPLHGVLSSISLLLLPVAGYAVGVVMNLDVFVGIVTLIAGICIIASIPVGKFTNQTVRRNIASYTVVSLPFLTSIVAGVGVSRNLTLALMLVCALVLPLCSTFVLWKSYFAGGDSRTKQWKSSLFASFGLRAGSLIFGLIFISTLFFDLSPTASGFSYAFWFLWIVLPPLQLIPLVINAKHSNIIPRWDAKSAYTSINGETTPLRAGAPVENASLQSVGSMTAKDLSDVAA